MNAKSLYQFTLYSIRPFFREPSTLFWSFFFPLIATVVFALAFSQETGGEGEPFILGLTENHQIEESFLNGIKAQKSIKIVDIPNLSQDSMANLTQKDGFENVNNMEPELKKIFFTQKVDVLIYEGQWYSTRNASQFRKVQQRLITIREKAKDNSLESKHIDVPGVRFEDWFIPGMIGLTLLSSGIFGIATRITANRERGLFKRLRLAPNSKAVFILGLAIARGFILFSEIIFLLIAFYFIFGFQVQGPVLDFVLVGMLASLCFCLLGAAVASRLRQAESAAGVANIFFMTMMFLSGVYFKVEHFPDWMQGFINALPLTALNNGFRAIANEGHNIFQLIPELTVLTVWSVVCAIFTWKYFDWGTET